MPIVSTDLRNTRERAGELRYYPNGAPIIATNVQNAIEQAANAGLTPVGTIVTVGMSPYTPLPTDTLLLVNTSAGAITIQMPLAATRTRDLEVKDATGNAVANPITVLPTAPETIDGLTVGAGGYPLDSAYAAAKIGPKTAGYFVHA